MMLAEFEGDNRKKTSFYTDACESGKSLNLSFLKLLNGEVSSLSEFVYVFVTNIDHIESNKILH